MPARDIAAQVHEWVADEAQKQSFTDDIGFAAYPIAAMKPGPQPGMMSRWTHWGIELSIRTGLIGASSQLRKLSIIERPDPKEAEVRNTVASVIEELRQARAQVKAVGNGKGPHGPLEVKGRG